MPFLLCKCFLGFNAVLSQAFVSSDEIEDSISLILVSELWWGEKPPHSGIAKAINSWLWSLGSTDSTEAWKCLKHNFLWSLRLMNKVNIRSELKIWDSFQLPYKQWSRSDLACLVDISHKLHKQNQTLLLLMVWHPWILDEDLDAQLCHHWFYKSVKHQVVIIWDKNIQFDCRTYDTDKLMNLYYMIHCDSLFLLTWNINWSMKPCFLNRKTSSTTENERGLM